MLMDMQFKLKEKDQKLINILLILTFNSIKGTPNVDFIRKELIINPSREHTWFKLLTMY